MKKLVTLSLVMLLSGCTSSEKNISHYAEEQIYKDYGVKVTAKSVTEIEGRGSALIYLLGKLLPARYEITLADTSDQKFTFQGNVDKDLTELEEQFLSNKHEYLLKNNKGYQEKNEILLKNGVTNVKMDGYSFHGKARIEITVYYNGNKANPKELVNTIYDMASMVVKVPYKISVSLNDDPTIKSEYFNVQTKEYSKNERKKLSDVLTSQLDIIHSNKLVNEEINSQLEELNLKANSFLEVDYNSSHGEKVSGQKITLHVRKYDESNLLKAFEFFREAGLEETPVQLYGADGETNYCKVKEIRNTTDIPRCFDKFYKH